MSSLNKTEDESQESYFVYSVFCATSLHKEPVMCFSILVMIYNKYLTDNTNNIFCDEIIAVASCIFITWR